MQNDNRIKSKSKFVRLFFVPKRNEMIIKCKKSATEDNKHHQFKP